MINKKEEKRTTETKENQSAVIDAIKNQSFNVYRKWQTKKEQSQKTREIINKIETISSEIINKFKDDDILSELKEIKL
jgi:hypothetical protein